jgi:hypothetical protein
MHPQPPHPSPSLLRQLLLKLPVILALGGGLDELLHDLVVVAVLAVVLVAEVVGVVLDLELAGQSQVVGVDPARGGGQGGVAVLLCPLIEDAGEEGGMPALDFLVVGLDDRLLVEVVLHCVAQHQEVGVDAFELLGAEGASQLLLLALPLLRGFEAA